ncbi:MAG: metal-dependent hydrolase [archaeon]|nr:metal-dependent hydrolase [archaeon]
MSSYKGHTLFALVLALLFSHNPLVVSLPIIGANIPDFDHDVKTENVYRLIIIGLLVFIVLYILKLPYFLGLILVFLGTIFYFSKHRSFTHSIFGLIILTVLITYLIIGVHDLFPDLLTYLVIIVLLSFLFLNRKLMIIFLITLILSLFIFNTGVLSLYQIAGPIFLGIFSHIVLDSFTSAGIRLFAPLSSKESHKIFGICSCILIVILAILFNFDFLINNYANFISF